MYIDPFWDSDMKGHFIVLRFTIAPTSDRGATVNRSITKRPVSESQKGLVVTVSDCMYHRRPFNACWRLLDLPELTPRKYIQQGTQLKFW